jgi:hypothetical protein
MYTAERLRGTVHYPSRTTYFNDADSKHSLSCRKINTSERDSYSVGRQNTEASRQMISEGRSKLSSHARRTTYRPTRSSLELPHHLYLVEQRLQSIVLDLYQTVQ